MLRSEGMTRFRKCSAYSLAPDSVATASHIREIIRFSSLYRPKGLWQYLSERGDLRGPIPKLMHALVSARDYARASPSADAGHLQALSGSPGALRRRARGACR